MKVTLVRHTRVAVPPEMCYGNSDVDVASTFEQEAAEVLSGLRGQAFDAVFTSPLQRCRKLATYCGYPDAMPDDRLKELNFGDWEGQLWHEITDPLLENWYTYWMDTPAGGAESFLDQYSRVSAFLDEVKERKYRHICLFIHRGTIEAILVYVGQLNLNQAFARPMDFGVRFTVEIE